MKKFNEYCDLLCEYSEFPKQDLGGANSCKTFDVLYCNLLEKHVTKNGKCVASKLEEISKNAETGI